MWEFIKIQILEKFAFLQNRFEFPAFETKQWKDEYYISSRKNHIEFSVYIQMESDCCPSIKVIKHYELSSPTQNQRTVFYLDEIEKDNPILKSIGSRGEENLSKFISECAKILKRNPELLKGG